MTRSRGVPELLLVLLDSPNDAWRDDAAEELGNAADQAGAEAALLEAITSSKLDDSLRRTCVESLVDIWVRRGRVPADKLGLLSGTSRAVAMALLRSARLLEAD